MERDLDSIVGSMELQDGLSFYLLVNRQKPSAMIDPIYAESAGDYGLRSKHSPFGFNVFLSYDQRLLQKLYKSDREQDIVNVGLSLGYPKEACRAFLKDKQAGTSFFMSVSRSFDETGRLPVHLAYLPYVPEPEAVEDGDSPSSVIGRHNMELVKEGAPTLSERLEESFEAIVLGFRYRR